MPAVHEHGLGSAQPNLVFHDYSPCEASFAAAFIHGLSAPKKAIPCRFLYDAAGSDLFEQICEQPEYYPTRSEMLILERNARAIADLVGPRAQLVELGSGAGRKIRLLLDALAAPSSYISVDISREALIGAATRLAGENRNIDIHAVWADYADLFDLPVSRTGKVIGFFPGSTIGNFERDMAKAFLSLWAERLGPDAGMIVGVDLVKSADVLELAYNDAAGVTAAFSLNLLQRANRELGADFNLDCFRHQARYNAERGAIEINLISQKCQKVTVGRNVFDFAKGEALHIENSHKYGVEEFAQMASQAGFEWRTAWTDPEGLFSVHYLTTPSEDLSEIA